MKYDSREGRQLIQEFLFDCSKKFDYLDLLVQGDVSEVPYEGYSQTAFNAVKPYFTRLRLGQLKSKKIEGCTVETSWVRVYLCYKGRAKVTVSSLCELGNGMSAERSVEIMDQVLVLEEGIGDLAFTNFYAGIPLKKTDKKTVVVHKTPNFDGVKEFERLVDEYRRPPDTLIAKRLSKEVFDLLRRRYPGTWDDAVTLLTAGREVRIDDAILFPIMTVGGHGILASYEHETHGFVKDEPFSACMRDLVNGVLLRA